MWKREYTAIYMGCGGTSKQKIKKTNKQKGMHEFQENLKQKMDQYVHFIYRITKNFPKDELYGVVSQIRRASLSIILNYIEGYARRKSKSKLNFWETSYASFQESKYLLVRQ